jgi:hypothetical protein
MRAVLIVATLAILVGCGGATSSTSRNAFSESWYVPEQRAAAASRPATAALSAKYHAVRSYRDQGIVLVREWDGTHRSATVSTFETIFIRSGAFRFLMFDEVGGLHAGVLGRHGHVQTWLRGRVQDASDLHSAMVSLAGVSDGVTVMVPFLLAGSDLSDRALDVATTTIFGCGECVALSRGTENDGTQRVFWVGAGVLRRYEEIVVLRQPSGPTFQRDRTTIYHPEFDAEPERLADEIEKYQWPAVDQSSN